MEIDVRSEIGELEGVILHTPGSEVENMIPESVERALYSDILNLRVARKEYSEFSSALSKVTKTFEVTDLLSDVLKNENVKRDLIERIFKTEKVDDSQAFLLAKPHDELARLLIEGVPMKKDNLTKFLDKDRYSLQPLHNFFFTRDASMSVFDKVLIAKTNSSVRMRESTIMEAIFKYHPNFATETINPLHNKHASDIVIEGGDVQIAKNDILCIGIGPRTTSHGVDFIIQCMLERKVKRDLIIQELPHSPESFIHLDMAFTFLDKDKCMIYEPLIKDQHYSTVHIHIDNGEVKSINYIDNILDGLKNLGMPMEPVICGGTKDTYIQEREQWHSGANFFALGPGKVIGYGRNVYTIEEMNKHGFEVLPAADIASGKIDPNDYEKYVITIEGSELSRGGGGARCMTMPVRRKPLEF